MIRTRSSLITLVEKNVGTAEAPEMVETFVARLEFEASSHGELAELNYIIGGIIGEIEGNHETPAPNPEDDKPETDHNHQPEQQVEGEPRRKRVRRTAAQIKADDEAEAAQKLAEGATGSKPEDPPFTTFNPPAPKEPKVAQPTPPVEPPKPEPVPFVPKGIVSQAMRDAVKPREVVRAIFDEDKDAEKEPRSVEAVVAFVKEHRQEIPCIAAMPDAEWEARVNTIAATIRSGLTIG